MDSPRSLASSAPPEPLLSKFLRLAERSPASQEVLHILMAILSSSYERESIEQMPHSVLRRFMGLAQRICRSTEEGLRALRTLHPAIYRLQLSTGMMLPLEAVESIELHRVLGNRTTAGASSRGRISKALWLGSALVCVKRARPRANRAESVALRKEVVVLKMLQHEGVVPVLGYSWESHEEEQFRRPFVVTPWFSNGSAPEFLKKQPGADRVAMVANMAAAVAYLHETGVIHGDIRAENFLINDQSEPVLSSFGRCSVVEDPRSLDRADGPITHSVRWTAPERLQGAYITAFSDTFSLAMTVLEVFTGAFPFSDLLSDRIVAEACIHGYRPARPASHGQEEERGLTDQVWQLLTEMWAANPQDRPSAKVVESKMGRYSSLHRSLERLRKNSNLLGIPPRAFSSASSYEEDHQRTLDAIPPPPPHIPRSAVVTAARRRSLNRNTVIIGTPPVSRRGSLKRPIGRVQEEQRHEQRPKMRGSLVSGELGLEEQARLARLLEEILEDSGGLRSS